MWWDISVQTVTLLWPIIPYLPNSWVIVAAPLQPHITFQSWRPYGIILLSVDMSSSNTMWWDCAGYFWCLPPTRYIFRIFVLHVHSVRSGHEVSLKCSQCFAANGLSRCARPQVIELTIATCPDGYLRICRVEILMWSSMFLCKPCSALYLTVTQLIHTGNMLTLQALRQRRRYRKQIVKVAVILLLLSTLAIIIFLHTVSSNNLFYAPEYYYLLCWYKGILELETIPSV